MTPTSIIELLSTMRQEVEKYPALYSNQRLLLEAIRRYEQIWLPLVAKHGSLGRQSDGRNQHVLFGRTKSELPG